MHKRLVYLALLLVTFLLQVTVAQEINVGRVKPDLILVVTVCLALFEGPVRGAIFGFWGGLLEDIFTTGFLGVAAFCKTLVGFFAGELKNRVTSASVLWPMIIVLLFTVASELVKFATWIVVGWAERPTFNINTVAGVALYNALVTLAVYPLVKRLVQHEEEVMLFK